MFGESSPPLTHDLRAHLKTPGDLGIRYAISGVEHDLRALHITVSQRQPRRPRLKLTTLLSAESDLNCAAHHHQDSPTAL